MAGFPLFPPGRWSTGSNLEASRQNEDWTLSVEIFC